MSLGIGERGTGRRRFPRVSGDEPFREAMSEGQISFSPRERG